MNPMPREYCLSIARHYQQSIAWVSALIRRVTDKIHIASTFLIQRAWIIESVVSILAVSGFSILWLYSGLSDIPIAHYIQSMWSILPVLALTNALPMLGVGAFMARYSASEKPSEIIANLSALVKEDYSRLNAHPRESSFQRLTTYRKLVEKTKVDNFLFYSEKESYYTPRPYWDGVWFFGDDDYPSKGFFDKRFLYAAHELIFCSIVMLQSVDELRRSNSYTISLGRRTGGTQGSIWFLEDFIRMRHKFIDIPPSLIAADAISVVYLAHNSIHYMTEELRRHHDELTQDERHLTIFINHITKYLIWMTYFHIKFLECRFIRASRSHSLERITKNVETRVIGMIKFRDDVMKLRNANIPRRAIAERVHQIKLGTLLPVSGTSAAILSYVCLVPIAYGLYDFRYAQILCGIAYVLASMSIGLNVTFGLWLLLPHNRHRPFEPIF